MRDFVGAEDLSFTPDEQEAIRQVANFGQPPVEAVPRARVRPQPPAPQRPRNPAPLLNFLVPPLPRPLHLARLAFFGSLAAAILLCLVSMKNFSDPSAHGPAYAFPKVAIARKAVHLRAEPSVSARSLTVIPAGNIVMVQQEQTDGFHRVLYGNLQGYAAAAYLAVSGGVEMHPHTALRIGQITGTARIREQPSRTGVVTAALPAYSAVTLLGVTPTGWCLVWTGNRGGFVWGGLLEPNRALPFRTRQDGQERAVEYTGAVLRP
jgi:hypothetical protein